MAVALTPPLSVIDTVCVPVAEEVGTVRVIGTRLPPESMKIGCVFQAMPAKVRLPTGTRPFGVMREPLTVVWVPIVALDGLSRRMPPDAASATGVMLARYGLARTPNSTMILTSRANFGACFILSSFIPLKWTPVSIARHE